VHISRMILLGIFGVILSGCSVGGEYGHSSALGTSPRYHHDFTRIVESFLRNDLTNCGDGQLHIEAIGPATQSDYIARFKISGLHNCVIKGHRLWELLDISFTRTGFNNQLVNINVDGWIAPGANLPPNSQFTTSMEPEFFRELSDFTKVLVNAFSKYTGASISR
jgi:hypothetical protein